MKLTKRLLALLLCLVLTAGMLSLFGVAANAYDTGDFIWYGSYPQSKVTDAAVINAFAKMTNLTWTDYGYYAGNGSFGSAAAGSYAKYVDFFYGTNRYRAVNITAYRPNLTYATTGAGYSNVDNNGYTIASGSSNNTFLFKWEPIKWRVLNPSTGLVVCESVLDAQPFHNAPYLASGNYYTNSAKKYYANEYAGVSLRTWLNDAFYAQAFTSTQKSNLKTVTLTQTTNDWLHHTPASSAVKVYPLSYYSVINSALGLNSNSTRLAKPTDYAKCQGVTVSSGGYSPWALSSYEDACSGSASDPYYYCRSADYISISGGISSDIVDSLKGVRPAMNLSTLKNDTNLTAQNTVTVTFHPYSGMTSFSTSEVYYGGYYGNLPVAYRSSSDVFGGWYTDQGQRITASSRVISSANHTLYAHYEPKTITVTLNPNGGTVSPTTLSIANNGESTKYAGLPTPSNPSGATFLGWYTTDGYLVKNGTVLSNRDHHTLVAQWKYQNVTVTFEPRGGTVSPTSKVYEAGTAYGTLPTPTRPGYQFNGWLPSLTSHGYVTATTTVGTTNHTLYASWTPIAAVKIKGYTPSRTVDYRTTITFTAEAANAPANVEYHWYVNGDRRDGAQTSLTLNEVTDDFEVYVLMRTPDNDIFVTSETEKVQVKHGFFDRLIAFFKGLFHALPVIEQK